MLGDSSGSAPTGLGRSSGGGDAAAVSHEGGGGRGGAGSHNSGEEGDRIMSSNNSKNHEEILMSSGTDRSFGGNRWPRQETIALLKIRSEMDVAFRDATVKGPLWDDVSR